MAEKSCGDFVDCLTDICIAQGILGAQEKEPIKKTFYERSEPQFEQFLLDEGIVEKDQLLRALSEYYKLPAIDVVGNFFDHHLVRMFPKDVMLRNGFIPYDHEGDIMIVVAAEPDDEELPALIGNFVSYDVTFMVGIFNDITDAVKEFYDEDLETAESMEYDREDARREHHPIETYPDENSEE
jgi:hypothetical protein